MTYIEMMEFFDTFEYVKDVPLPVAINIYFDGEIIENAEKVLLLIWEQKDYPKKNTIAL